ncbi:MAG: methyltransferase [Solobacterium sp.]|nr:methyltransferase [Solobacterium sp.]
MSDYLPGTDLIIDQRENDYHFSSDAQLLGEFLKIRHKDTVLDIGCGSGVLLLYASLHQPKAMYGIDLYEEIIRQAEHNLALNGLSAELITGRIQDYRERRFDVIVCNPPFFPATEENLMKTDPVLRAARHETELSLTDLFLSVNALLEEKGHFFLVHRAQRFNDIMRRAQDNGLALKRIRTVCRKQNGSVRCILMEFVRGAATECTFEPPQYL